MQASVKEPVHRLGGGNHGRQQDHPALEPGREELDLPVPVRVLRVGGAVRQRAASTTAKAAAATLTIDSRASEKIAADPVR